MSTTTVYLYTLFFVCVFASVAMTSIWLTFQSSTFNDTKEKDEPVDYGFFWLACALLAWAVASVWSINHKAVTLLSNENTYQGIRAIISSINNIFLLLALKYFDRVPPQLEKVREHKNFVKVVILLSVIAVISSSVLFATLGTSKSFFPDVILSTISLFLLGTGLAYSFWFRNLKMVSLLSGATIILTIISQWLILFEMLDYWQVFILLTSKIAIIMMFMALAVTFIIEKSRLPEPKEMKLSFNAFGTVDLLIPGKIDEKAIKLKDAQYGTMLKLAFCRKTTDSGWLDYKKEKISLNYFTRLAEDIRARIVLSNDKEKDTLVNWIKDSLIENDWSGKRRLKIPPEGIFFDDKTICSKKNAEEASNLHVFLCDTFCPHFERQHPPS